MFKQSLVLFAVVAAVAYAVPSIPNPSQYYMSGTFSIPYFNIVEPIELIYDGVNNRQYISYYNGMDITLNLFEQNISYSIGPQVNTLICQTIPGNGSLITVLPPIPSEWSFNGTSTVNGIDVFSYTQKVVNYGKAAYYTFYVNSDGTPVQFYLNGVDFIFDSHPDVYILDFTTWTTDISQYGSIWEVPALCNNAEEATHAQFDQFEEIFGHIDSSNKKMDSSFDQFKKQFGKTYENTLEHNTRFATYKQMLHRVATHNAHNSESTYKLAMNHFGDMSDEEFRKFIIPHVDRDENNGASEVHDNEDVSALPASLDWRTSGCVTPVKDQGVCGSCWTFGSLASLETVACLKHNKDLISLSEQELVDCAYVGQSMGCNGGFASNAYQYIMNAGGIATESDYPYLMQNAYCKASTVQNSGVRVQSYVNVTAFSEAALQNAVATVGVVAVAIDASAPDFRYYSSGVYYSTVCQSGLDYLDHEVAVLGYGTDNGQQYWIVKNSWSTYYGNEGIVWMAMNRDNNCGIASQATYPIAV
ncbi:counting factor associated protein [Cavenderia fasciculata]|uniref:Counting factor associated protein n=1 Tax=Cavenderia fasciculata TaxID=261658 RepID=F4PK92_CACFS|nr:counting factor associated protein [Cavenderia fasciculata]EGG24016.1 counting factor associated protein [Cavenderia fasciculata]|eukprot:XP_004361867.1 counting factor associated protein [Cavenderia fasciculata]